MATVGRLARLLHRKAKVVTRAVFWKIPHDSGREDIRLKIGRYKRPDDPDDEEQLDVAEPKSELTLDDAEFKALVAFLQESYEPFRQGVRAFIPLDRPFEPATAQQIRALFSLPDRRELVRFILKNDVIPEDLARGLQFARRSRALKQFEAMLGEDRLESEWQAWFKQNCWILGRESCACSTSAASTRSISPTSCWKPTMASSTSWKSSARRAA